MSEDGAVARLTRDGGAAAYASPSVSRDGSVLAFLRGGAPYRGGARGAGAARLLDTEDARELSLSADGGTVAVRTVGERDDGGLVPVLESRVAVVGALGPRLWSSDAEAAEPGWAGGDLLLTSTGADGRAVVCRPPLAPSGGLPPCGRAVADDPGATLAEPAGAPDGRVVVATATTLDGAASRIVAYDAAGAGAPLRALSSGPADSSPSLSPDGTRVAFTRGSDTWVAPLAGGPERPLARGVVDASWGGPLPGRPRLVPGSLRARGRSATLRIRCRAAAGCVAATWTLRRGGRVAARFAVPELAAGASARLRARLRRGDAVAVARSGPRGVRVSLSGAGPVPRPVRVRRAA